jgi:disulfide bond formation protein DsbB
VRVFQRIGRNKWYWVSMIAGAAALELIALYYQYALNQYPCVLCIQVRIWVFAFILVGALGLILRHSRVGLIAANLLSLIAAIGFAERSWETLATEKGWSTNLACSMDAGLPAWFALDKWFPALFQVQASCGRTPIVAMNITMAEVLIVVAVTAVLATALISAGSLFAPKRFS